MYKAFKIFEGVVFIMTVQTLEKTKKNIYLTVGETKHLCYVLSYMTRSVKNGIKKVSASRKEYRQKYNDYINMRDYMIDQFKPYKDEKDNKTIEIAIEKEDVSMLNEFVRQQIHLFDDLLVKSTDDLNKNIHAHIVPLQTIAYKLQ